MRRALLGMLLMLGVVLGGAVYLLRSHPDHWAGHQAFLKSHTPQQLEELAARVEERLERLIREASSAGRTESVADEPQSIQDHPAKSTSEAGKTGERKSLVEGRGVSAATAGRVLAALNLRPEDVRIDELTELFVSEEEMRALVATRLGRWMEERGYVMPQGIHDPMIAVDDQGLLLAFEVSTPYVNQVFTARFDVRLLPDGMGMLELRKLWAGRLPLPVEGLGRFIRTQATAGSRAERLAGWLDKLHGLEFRPVLELAHRRRARVERMEVLAEGVRASVRVQDHLTYRQTNQTLATVSVDVE